MYQYMKSILSLLTDIDRPDASLGCRKDQAEHGRTRQRLASREVSAHQVRSSSHVPENIEETYLFSLSSIWRPLTPVVESAPLGICHFSTFHPEDLIPIDVVFPHFVEEAYEARPSPHQRWYYRSKMTNNDVILLKIYDNKEGVAFSR